MRIYLLLMLTILLLIPTSVVISMEVLLPHYYFHSKTPLDIPINRWHIIDCYSHSPTHCWWCGPIDSDKYSLGYETYLKSPKFNLDENAKRITLYFYQDIDTSNDYNGGDYCRVIVVSDQMQPTVIYEKNSPYDTNGWNQETLDLTTYRGQTNFQIRFIFKPDEDTLVDEGWLIDDVLLETELTDADLIANVEFDEYLPPDWSQNPPSNDTNDWHQSGSQNAHVAKRDYLPPENNSTDDLITPIVDSTNFTTLNIEYWTLYNKYDPIPGYHHAQVLGSIDGGITWTYEIKWYGFDDFIGNEKFDISSWATGKSQLRFMWRIRCQSYTDVYTWEIDKVRVYGDKKRTDFEDDIENGKDGWRTGEWNIETSSIGIIKAIFEQ